MSDDADWKSWPPDSLDGMPPKRRRLVAWALVWFFFVQSIAADVLLSIGLPLILTTLIGLVITLAVFGPLLHGARQETRQLRAQDEEPPARPVTGKSLVFLAAMTVLAWAGVVVFMALTGKPQVPVFQVLLTAWVMFHAYKWRTQDRPATPGPP